MATTLAHRMRPTSLKDVLGQKHIVGENALFSQFVKKKHPIRLFFMVHLDAERQQLHQL